MDVLGGLEPAGVFRFFGEISAIPRGSGNEKGISDYVARFARERGLSCEQDAAFNVVVRKGGGKGFESAAPVIIQGHLDMVCEKNGGTAHDFLKDPLKLRLNGDELTAEGTTLGADNGVAVAMALALLDGDYAVPPIIALFTTGEEVGMDGAAAVPAGWLAADMLINLDSEEEGIFMSSCAGGAKPTVRLDAPLLPVGGEAERFRVAVKGLKGGHSGLEIHKGRGNANVIIGRALDLALDCPSLRLAGIKGGMRDNAIPREAEMTVALSPVELGAFMSAMDGFAAAVKKEYRVTDSNVTITAEPAAHGDTAMSRADSERVAGLLLGLPNGVLAMSADVAGLVETSNNVGVVSYDGDEAAVVCASRSNVSSRLEMVLRQVKRVAASLGGRVTVRGQYPAWEYDPESRLRKVFCERYAALYGKAAEVEAVHAGLECGLFIQKRPGLDVISLGPNLWDVHTPDERASVSSIRRTWEFLLITLGHIARGA